MHIESFGVISPCARSTEGLVPDQDSSELYDLVLHEMFHMQQEVHQQQLDRIHQVPETYKISAYVKIQNTIRNLKIY